MEDVCKEKHKRIDEKFDTQEKRINNHSGRIDALEQFKSGTEKEIKNLIEQIKSLVSVMKWFIGLLVGAFVGFFFYVVQQGILR